jgi:hypothetical protein
VQKGLACRLGPFCLHWATEIQAERKLEVKNGTGGNPQIILSLRSHSELVETREQVFDLHRTDRETVGNFVIHTATNGHGERIIRSGKCQAIAAADVRYAE